MTDKKALIYCRVSSTKQAISGSGLDSQEHRCRKQVIDKGYTLEGVFPDDVSGGVDFMKRPGMVSLLAHLEVNPDTNYIVIFDDLKRLARNTIYHWQLRYALASFGATVECLNYKFDETPEGEFMETLFAAQGQLERKQISRQTLQKTKARLEKGYYAFNAPVGYCFKLTKTHGKILVRNEPVASILQEALESYAGGRFQTRAEVKHFLDSQPEFPRGPGGKVGSARIDEMMARVLYAGYIEYKPWNVSRRKAHHEPIISYETFLKIQERLAGQAYAPARKNLHEDFPLRGFVACSCGVPLTAAWSKGRNKRYPYYFCQSKGCELKGKSIKRANIEGDFEKLIRTLTPSRSMIVVADAMFRDIWDHRINHQHEQKDNLEIERRKTITQIDRLLDRIVDTDVPTVIGALEKKIKNSEDRVRVLDEKIANCGKSLKGFDETYRTAMQFLAKPYLLWDSGALENRHALMKLAFTSRPTYTRGEGYRTVETALPFKTLSGFNGCDSKMVPRRGIEPPTY